MNPKPSTLNSSRNVGAVIVRRGFRGDADLRLVERRMTFACAGPATATDTAFAEPEMGNGAMKARPQKDCNQGQEVVELLMN